MIATTKACNRFISLFPWKSSAHSMTASSAGAGFRDQRPMARRRTALGFWVLGSGFYVLVLGSTFWFWVRDSGFGATVNQEPEPRTQNEEPGTRSLANSAASSPSGRR